MYEGADEMSSGVIAHFDHDVSQCVLMHPRVEYTDVHLASRTSRCVSVHDIITERPHSTNKRNSSSLNSGT